MFAAELQSFLSLSLTQIIAHQEWIDFHSLFYSYFMRTQICLDAIRDEKQSGGRLEGEPLTKGFLALVFKPTPAIKYLLLQSGMSGKLHMIFHVNSMLIL